MQTLTFFKYQGTGNDFILIDNRNAGLKLSQKTIATLCERRFGIGADGLILLQNHASYDFEMLYFNADGKEGSMCGNGGRCIVKFAYHLGIFKEKTLFWAIDGLHEAFLDAEKKVHLKMGDVEQIEIADNYFFLDTGSPHYVEYVQEVENVDVFQRGREVRYNEIFKEKGTNVNFVEQLEGNAIAVRTYERGVEAETFSCGTGVTACALVSSLEGKQSPLRIQTKGGELQVAFQLRNDGGFENIYLIGAAERVFTGEMAYD